VSNYRGELAEAKRRGNVAHGAMEAWVSRPLDAPDVQGEVLEGFRQGLSIRDKPDPVDDAGFAVKTRNVERRNGLRAGFTDGALVSRTSSRMAPMR
jgi:hypothetical protein